MTFDLLPYNQTSIGKTHTYTITEVPSGETGMASDPMSLVVTVAVSDLGGGKLLAEPDYPEDTEFNNSYTASGGIVLAATKSLDLGAGGRLVQEGEFSFNLYEGTDTSGTPLQTKKNAADGSVAFDAIPYTQADIGKTFAYTITEVPNTETGMASDPMSLLVTVAVTDGGNGTLLATPDYPEDTEFNNRYTAKDEIVLETQKALSGRALSASEFIFELWQLDGPDGERSAQKPVSTARNDAAGKVSFPAIPYTQTDIGKTYHYEIIEIPGSASGVQYDPMRLKASVTVSDLGGGVLKAAATYPEDTTFINTYTAPSTPRPQTYDGISVPVEVGKVLTGRALTEGEFQFILKDAAGNTVAQVSNDASGRIRFPDRFYRRPGLYLYEITEVKGSQEDILYDGTVFGLRVNVEASGGSLSASVSYRKDGSPFGGEIAFVNAYTPPKTGDSQPMLITLLTSGALLALLLSLGFSGRGLSRSRGKRKPSR